LRAQESKVKGKVNWPHKPKEGLQRPPSTDLLPGCERIDYCHGESGAVELRRFSAATAVIDSRNTEEGKSTQGCLGRQGWLSNLSARRLCAL
jgi:hypothetical protein